MLSFWLYNDVRNRRNVVSFLTFLKFLKMILSNILSQLFKVKYRLYLLKIVKVGVLVRKQAWLFVERLYFVSQVLFSCSLLFNVFCRCESVHEDRTSLDVRSLHIHCNIVRSPHKIVRSWIDCSIFAARVWELQNCLFGQCCKFVAIRIMHSGSVNSKHYHPRNLSIAVITLKNFYLRKLDLLTAYLGKLNFFYVWAIFPR